MSFKEDIKNANECLEFLLKTTKELLDEWDAPPGITEDVVVRYFETLHIKTLISIKVKRFETAKECIFEMKKFILTLFEEVEDMKAILSDRGYLKWCDYLKGFDMKLDWLITQYSVLSSKTRKQYEKKEEEMEDILKTFEANEIKDEDYIDDPLDDYTSKDKMIVDAKLYHGKIFLRTKTNKIMKNCEPEIVGHWNEDTKTISFYKKYDELE